MEGRWRRIVFNIEVKNTDDHRHRMSTPMKRVSALVLNISETDSSLDFDLALSFAKYFRVEKNAESILKRVRRSIGKWKTKEKKYAIPASEIGRM